jgi:hypothetical protein
MTPISKLVGALLAIGALILVIENSSAQSQGNGPNQSEVPAVTPISGARDPSRVPYSHKYSFFIATYPTFREVLLPQLSGDDDAILSALADQEEYWVGVENAQHMESLRSVCAVRQSLNAVALANRIDSLAKQFRDNRGNRYRNAMRQLSTEGRQAVEEFVETSIVPGIETGLPNIVEYARANPSEYKDSVEIDCYVADHGELPPDVKEMAEAQIEKRKRELGIVDSSNDGIVGVSTENLQ